jgi:hypothetical protein
MTISTINYASRNNGYSQFDSKEHRIRNLGGPDYIRRAQIIGIGAEGVSVPGTKGYK